MRIQVLDVIRGLAILDILSRYAVTGTIMFFCRSRRPKTLLGIGIALYAAMAIFNIPRSALPFAASPPMTAAAADPAVTAKPQTRIAQTLAEAKGSWAGAYRVNAREYADLLSGDPWLIPQTLGPMMVGLGLFRFGFLAGRSSRRRYAITIAIGVPTSALLGWLSWQTTVLGRRLPGEHLRWVSQTTFLVRP